MALRVIEIRRSALVRHTPARMFALVNDVEAYPKRFGWCADARVLERDGDVLLARLDLKFAGLRQSFTTRNVAEPPTRLRVSLVEGPFRHLEGQWDFLPLGEHGCKIVFALDFEYTGLAAGVLRMGFQGLASRMVEDFGKAADQAYG
jgi:ribosome-associated toxin RatA of RatAB toxin-antitoxin module